ncbi:MAG: class II aldolase/adducin family protein [Candidatus Omnitrophota bacterium]
MQTKIEDIKKIGRWIWEKDLSGGLSGNLSIRLDEKTVLITGRGTCLGDLRNEDVCTMDMEGNALQKGFVPSSEKPFHLSVYKNLEARAVVHVHPTFSNGYFAAHDAISFDTFETRLSLGDVPVIDQKTPTITDISPVIEALKNSNIVVLKHHGVVAIGETLKEAFFLAQTLEEAVKVACVKGLYAGPQTSQASEDATAGQASQATYDLFSPQQISEIVRLVNNDAQFRQLALQTNLETKLAVVLDETQTAYCFHFSGGGIKDFVTDASEAEFVISGKADYWRAIFKRQLDPFAATTQKKLKLKGDFAKISRWYVPFNRLFDLWTCAPVK